MARGKIKFACAGGGWSTKGLIRVQGAEASDDRTWALVDQLRALGDAELAYSVVLAKAPCGAEEYVYNAEWLATMGVSERDTQRTLGETRGERAWL
jgi:hypothetical protein